MTMKRVMYVSKARHRMTAGELSDLLAGARLRNEAHEITGALVYAAGHFAQVLEGPSVKIDQLLANIAGDPRHDEYYLVSEGPIEERYFVGWAMDWTDLGRYEDTKYPRLRALMREHTIADRDAVYKALTTFLTEHVREIVPSNADRQRWNW
ncbi:MAG: BLUF domain-containing protein [Proteobacteria bacterium]|nr:BLUF domain-containing protein [Pseudomonadota bacterium]